MPFVDGMVGRGQRHLLLKQTKLLSSVVGHRKKMFFYLFGEKDSSTKDYSPCAKCPINVGIRYKVVCKTCDQKMLRL